VPTLHRSGGNETIYGLTRITLLRILLARIDHEQPAEPAEVAAATIESPQEREVAYLAGAVDICDLERRLRVIDGRGRGDWSPISHGLYAC